MALPAQISHTPGCFFRPLEPPHGFAIRGKTDSLQNSQVLLFPPSWGALEAYQLAIIFACDWYATVEKILGMKCCVVENDFVCWKMNRQGQLSASFSPAISTFGASETLWNEVTHLIWRDCQLKTPGYPVICPPDIFSRKLPSSVYPSLVHFEPDIYRNLTHLGIAPTALSSHLGVTRWTGTLLV